jgi:RHS repeat-associated protein
VLENPGSGQYSTNYLYNVLDDLTVVCQGSFDAYGNCQSGGLGRSFSYDSLKRLMYAMNPESGTISYSYDDNGNVLTKTDARGWVTCYGTYSGSSCANGYDPINRPTAKTYYNAAAPANTIAAPSVAWVWDTISKGRLSSVSAASASPSYTSSTQFQAYDTMGRVTQSTQTTNGNNYTFYYAYNLAGTVESETYPSARAVKTCYDSAGRSLSVAGTPSSGQTTTYASNVTYAPHGAIQQISRGDTLTEIRSYNNRLQENAISLGTSGNARSAFGQDMYYCANGAATCTTNNGNLLSLNLPYLSAQQSFTYDPINRLTAAAETSPGTGWSQSYGYDAFGNRWVSGGITTSPFTPVAASNFDTNNRLQIQGTQYDASGGMTAIGGYTYQNDSEGHIAAVAINGSSTLYGYDGDNHRILKQAPAGTTIYVYDASGDLSAEYSTATQMNPCLTCYLTADYLGSTRLITSSAGATVSQHDYLPFGEEVPLAYGGRTALPGFQAGSADDVNQKFTGKERDAESGLDYFGARYYGSALGRFTSPDEVVADQHPDDPQSWNLYGYVRNRPLSSVDPNGRGDTFIFPPIMFGQKSINAAGEAGIAFAKSYINGAKEGYNNLSNVVSEVSGGRIDMGHAAVTPLSPADQSKADSVGLAVSIVVGAKGGAEANVSEGIYEFPDATAPGKTYVGQSGRLPDRLGEHVASGKLEPGTEVTATEVPGGKTSREVAEQKRMDELGGKSTTPGSQTSNQRNSVSPERMKRLENGQSQ